MPKYEQPEPDTENMKQVAQMITLANGGQDLRDG